MLLLLISFIAGILTILAPCVLPAIPIVIGGSVGGDVQKKARPYIVVASLTISIILFTLLLKVSTILINVPPDALNWLSGGLLIGLGIAATFPTLWELLVIRFNWQAKSDQLLNESQKQKNPYIGPVLIGAALGPVFASCSPTYAFILASVLPRSFFSGLIYLIVYAIGLSVALLVVSLAGRKALKKYRWAIDTHSVFRRSLGVLFIIIGVVVFVGLQIKVETWIANQLPFDETKIEQVLLAGQQQNTIVQKLIKSAADSSVLNVRPTPAPELQGLTSWINSKPQTLAGLKGKVVLVDFWTYSCINCIRTLPYIKTWYQTYKNDGFIVLGINTPEFAFEHNPENVQAAVKSFGITYPVALDNNYDTWNAFGNNSWPADYLIDKNGAIRYTAVGEGDYSTTEKAIQELLGVNRPLSEGTVTVPITGKQTPETYLGTDRASNYVGSPNETEVIGKTTTFEASPILSQNQWTLHGSWNIKANSITSNSNSTTLSFHITAKDAYVIATPTAGTTQQLDVSLPSSSSSIYGSDVIHGSVKVDQERLYHIISGSSVNDPVVTLNVPKGMSLYTFTFGS
jgi:cytochrome c biogenesis protein CcdA/thiol-disulfide isomerase/thioredoxin